MCATSSSPPPSPSTARSSSAGMAAAAPSRPSGALQPLRTSYAVGARLVRVFPPAVRYPVAAFGGTVWWAADRGRRHNAWINYGAALGLPEDHARVREVARRAFANYGRMLADFLLMGGLTPEEVR